MFNLFKCKTDIKPQPKTIDDRIAEAATLKRLKADRIDKAKEDFQQRVASLLSQSKYVTVELVNDEVRVFCNGRNTFFLKLRLVTKEYFEYSVHGTANHMLITDDNLVKAVSNFVIDHYGSFEDIQ